MAMQIQHRNEFPSIIDALGYKIGAEVGVARGQFSDRLMGAGFTRFYMIDDFCATKPVPGEIYEVWRPQAWQVAANHPGVAVVIEKPSVEAAVAFDDGSMDFVYIDAQHEDPWAHEDVATWWPKIRPGGMLAGHDYTPCNMGARAPYGVMLAVEELIASQGVTIWVTGARGTSYVDRLVAGFKGLAMEVNGTFGDFAENVPSWYAVKP